jgi:hypothetical protein
MSVTRSSKQQDEDASTPPSDAKLGYPSHAYLRDGASDD